MSMNNKKILKILWLSDFDLRGSGYLNISIPLCTGLAEKGYEVRCLGFGYRGQNHEFPFPIIPAANLKEIWAMLQNLVSLWKFDVLVVALDIPLQEQILARIQSREFKYVGIMPIESDPLCVPWAMTLAAMDKAFIISEFGTNEAKKAGVEAEHLQVGINTDLWRKPIQGERTQIRKAMLGLDDDAFIVLTVADNQERKNLSKAMEIFIKFAEGKDNARWIIVTREHNMSGWRLRALAEALPDILGLPPISDKLMIFERGMSFQELWSFYATSDCFMLTSKAEGLGMPILEAMAVGLPVLATGCTGMKELISGNRGFELEYDYVYIDPFGNGNRYFTKAHSGLWGLNSVFYDEMDRLDVIVERARKYVEKRTWDIPIESLDRALKELDNEKGA